MVFEMQAFEFILIEIFIYKNMYTLMHQSGPQATELMEVGAHYFNSTIHVTSIPDSTIQNLFSMSRLSHVRPSVFLPSVLYSDLCLNLHEFKIIKMLVKKHNLYFIFLPLWLNLLSNTYVFF